MILEDQEIHLAFEMPVELPVGKGSLFSSLKFSGESETDI